MVTLSIDGKCVSNPLGISLLIDFPFVDSTITSIQQPDGVSNNVNLLTSNSWAEVLEEEENTAQISKSKAMKKKLKANMGVRTRRGHVSNPSSS